MINAASGDAPIGGTGSGPSRFQTTSWTAILSARDNADPASQRHLELLIQRYWRPVYRLMRSMGRTHEDAKDHTQSFFTHFLEKDVLKYVDPERGRFRSFVIASVKRFLALVHRKESRNPELSVPDFDSALHERFFGHDASSDPDVEFTRNWLKCVVENAVSILRAECVAMRKERQYAAFDARYLQQDRAYRSCREVAAFLGTSEKDVENLLSRARNRFRRIFRNEIRGSVAEGTDPDDEIRELLSVL
jgi:RNA polymerase sigma factor (sigma-70 family)